MSKLQIIGAPQSPFVWAVRMAAAEKGVEAENIFAAPHTPEIQAMQPFGKIPVMRHGEIVLSESRAIALYIDRLNDRNPLVPRGLVEAAHAEEWIMHYYTEYAPLMLWRYIAAYFFPKTPDGAPNRALIDPALPELEKAVRILEDRLDGRDYLAGPFSFADILFAPTLHYFKGLPEGSRMVAQSPRVTAYIARLAARPSFKETLPPPLPAREVKAA